MSVFLSTFLMCAVLASWGLETPSISIVVAGVGAFAGLFFGLISPMFFIHAVVIFAGTCVGVALRFRVPVLAGMLSISFLGIYGWAFSAAFSEYQNIQAMRRDYPIVSLSKRLTFEDHSSSPEVMGNLQEYSKEVMEALGKIEEDTGYRGRYRALKSLHKDTSRQFAAAAGFGFVRMRSVRPRYLELDVTNLVDSPMIISEEILLAEGVLSGGSLHDTIRSNFLNPESFGYIPEREKSAGFVSHRLHRRAFPNEEQSEANVVWETVRLELLSLLRHNPPRVYVAGELPQMDELEGVPHRPLSEFESEALTKLWFEQNVVIREAEGSIEMLGALRADSNCLQCHSGNRGRLLGAFSYELREKSNQIASVNPRN